MTRRPHGRTTPAFIPVLFASATLAIALLLTQAVGSGVGPRSAGGPAPVTDGASIGTMAGTDLAVEDENPEAEEQAETVTRRRDALERAVAAGAQVGQHRPRGDRPTAGWAGEQPFEATAPDDWEPAVAADPASPFVYMLATRYGTPKPCKGNCPSPYIALRVSADGGATFGPSRPLCACKGSGQYDPIIEVAPGTGAVYAVYMNRFDTMFVRSTDHGATWTSPVPVYGKVSWTDKPVLATSDDGQDVYVTFNGPTGGDPWLAQSHDAGVTWTQERLVSSDRYVFAFDADVASDGTVYLAESSLLYGGGGNKGSYPIGAIEEHVFVSRDQGATWEDHMVTEVQPGVPCQAAGCSPDFYLGHTALTVDGGGDVVLAYDGAATMGGPQTIEARRSGDDGRTWSAPVTLSVAGEEAIEPALEAGPAGDIRGWYYQTSGSGDVDAWNVWFRRSTDGGATWSEPVKLSDATGGAAYKTDAGFLEPYGDYGELAITSTGSSIAVWGEGTSYDGPGGVWYNLQN